MQCFFLLLLYITLGLSFKCIHILLEKFMAVDKLVLYTEYSVAQIFKLELYTRRSLLKQFMHYNAMPLALTRWGTAPGLWVLMDLIVLTTSICPSAFNCSIRDQMAMNVMSLQVEKDIM